LNFRILSRIENYWSKCAV